MFYPISTCASSWRLHSAFGGPEGCSRAAEFLHSRSVCTASLCTHTHSRLLVCSGCWPYSHQQGMHFLKENRITRLHFCFLLRHNSTLRGKSSHRMQEMYDTQKESVQVPNSQTEINQPTNPNQTKVPKAWIGIVKEQATKKQGHQEEKGVYLISLVAGTHKLHLSEQNCLRSK